MQATQKKAIDRLLRVQEFLAVHPPPESPGYTAQKKALEDVIAGLREHSIDQVSGRRSSRGQVARLETLTRRLRAEHLRPIAAIARESLPDAPEINRELRSPTHGISPIKLLAEAESMRGAAARYEARFVEAGMAPDFLQQLGAAIETIRGTISGKARSVGQQIGGRLGMNEDIKRARRVVTGLDAVVQRAFRDQQDVLEKWRTTKRVHALANTSGGVSSSVAPDITPVQAPAAAEVAGRVA
jgi:hypothetical protein